MCGLEWNKALLAMALTSGTDVSINAFEPEEDIFNIQCNISQNVANCNKLS